MGRLVRTIIEHHPALDIRIPVYAFVGHAVLWREVRTVVINEEWDRVPLGPRKKRMSVCAQSGEIFRLPRLVHKEGLLARQVGKTVPKLQPAFAAPNIEVLVVPSSDGRIDEFGVVVRYAREIGCGEIVQVEERVSIIVGYPYDGARGAGAKILNAVTKQTISKAP